MTGKRASEDRYKQAAIDYPRKLHGDRREYLYTKPFGTDPWGDDFCGKLHDFAHLVEVLRLPPGAAVLDVACGPGWLSEYLARLGYRATGIDISPDMIDVARTRVTRLAYPQAGIDASFQVVDGEGFTLGRQFDAAVIYDALHHFEDDGAVLASVFRHLRPGGRLFLKEPLAHHPDAPETRAEVAEFGVLERGFTRDALVTALTGAGFLPPVVLRQADMMLDEGRLAPGYIGAVMASTPVYHLLLAARPGPGAIDSRWPGQLRAALSVDGLPGAATPGTTFDVAVTAVNQGDTLWLHRPMRYGGHVRLGVQLLGPDGATIGADWASRFLSRDVAPGDSVTERVSIAMPERPGRYIVRFDLVVEFIAWFHDRGSRPLEVALEIASIEE